MESVNVSNQIFTTSSSGRTHIAVGKDYVGSVNSYNNFITKFFAKIFHKSIQVDFDGSRYSVNKKSYKKMLNNFSNKNIKTGNLSSYSNFSTFISDKQTPKGKFMRNAISSWKRQKLYTNLSRAISSGDTDKAIQMIGQGATLDKPYYQRGNISPSFTNDTEGLLPHENYKFHVCYAPPIIQADQKKNQKIVETLKLFGAAQNATGKTYLFKRNIDKVSKQIKFNPISKSFEVETNIHMKDIRKNHKIVKLSKAA